MDQDRWYESLEACRQQSDDLALPELSELAGRLQDDPALQARLQQIHRWDEQITKAASDVPVPDGFQQRLLDSLQPAPNTPAETVERPAPASRLGQWFSRPAVRWAAAGVTVAAVVTIAIVWWQLTRPEPLSGQFLAQQSHLWIDSLDPRQWNLEDPPLQQYPLDPSVRLKPRRWQRKPLLGDNKAVVYLDQTPPDRMDAFLFVIRTKQDRAKLPGLPPKAPHSSTGGRCVAAWKSGEELVYVLVVHGDRARYQSVLRMINIAWRATGDGGPLGA